MRVRYTKTVTVIGLCLTIGYLFPGVAYGQTQDSGSVGIEGRISAPPPTTGATINTPRDGQIFTNLPVTVAGLCPNGLLVKVFKNNVFGGSVQCSNGSFSLQIDLFSGLNELVARVYDDLDQPGPDSNIARVTFNDGRPGAGSRVGLTSVFAKRGANPGQTLTWPIVMTGGQGPYAVSVDWGDGKPIDLISRALAGPFDIQHVYDNPGIYNIIVKAVDKDGGVAYLQLVGVANGPLSQDSNAAAASTSDEDAPPAKVLWQPAAISIPLIMATFWLGKKYELKMIRKRLEHGERPL